MDSDIANDDSSHRRRSFMERPLEERREIMRQEAEELQQHYEDTFDLTDEDLDEETRFANPHLRIFPVQSEISDRRGSDQPPQSLGPPSKRPHPFSAQVTRSKA